MIFDNAEALVAVFVGRAVEAFGKDGAAGKRHQSRAALLESAADARHDGCEIVGVGRQRQAQVVIDVPRHAGQMGDRVGVERLPDAEPIGRLMPGERQGGQHAALSAASTVAGL